MLFATSWNLRFKGDTFRKYAIEGKGPAMRVYKRGLTENGDGKEVVSLKAPEPRVGFY